MKSSFFNPTEKWRILLRFMLATGFLCFAYYYYNSVTNHMLTLKVGAYLAVGIAYIVLGVTGFKNLRKKLGA